MQKLFSRLDKAGDGVISLQELTAAVRKILPGITDRAVRNLFKYMDRQGRGKIGRETFDEFIEKRESKQLSPNHTHDRPYRSATKAATSIATKATHYTFHRRQSLSTSIGNGNVRGAKQSSGVDVDFDFDEEHCGGDMYSIDIDAVMNLHRNSAQEFDRRQSVLNGYLQEGHRSTEFATATASETCITASTSSIHPVQTPGGDNECFTMYIVDKNDHVFFWREVKALSQFAQVKLYHESLVDFKEKSEVPLVDKRPIEEIYQAAQEEYECRQRNLEDALMQGHLPTTDPVSEEKTVRLMTNEFASIHFLDGDVLSPAKQQMSSEENESCEEERGRQRGVFFKYLVRHDGSVIFVGGGERSSIRSEEIRHALDDFLDKQTLVYDQEAAMKVADKIRRELNSNSGTGAPLAMSIFYINLRSHNYRCLKSICCSE